MGKYKLGDNIPNYGFYRLNEPAIISNIDEDGMVTISNHGEILCITDKATLKSEYDIEID